MSEQDHEIYHLMLGDSCHLAGWDVDRVPGGWLFYARNNGNLSPVFVPLPPARETGQ